MSLEVAVRHVELDFRNRPSVCAVPCGVSSNSMIRSSTIADLTPGMSDKAERCLPTAKTTGLLFPSLARTAAPAGSTGLVAQVDHGRERVRQVSA